MDATGNQDPKAECASAYEGAQEARAAGRLIQAREFLVVCAQASCPSFVQSDCSQWLTEVQDDVPSVVFAAKSPAGEETVDVKVTVDDQVVVESLDGRAVDLDPGVHVFKFEHAALLPVERRVVVRQGEKNRVIEVNFKAGAGSSPGTTDEPDFMDEEPETSSDMSHLRPLAYVGWGVGAVGVGTGIVFILSGKSEENKFLDECDNDGVLSGEPGCTDADLSDTNDSVDQKFLIGNIAVGVGAAGLVGGTILFFLTADESGADDTALNFNLSPIRGGSFATVSGRF